jgi:hypothetical protein
VNFSLDGYVTLGYSDTRRRWSADDLIKMKAAVLDDFQFPEGGPPRLELMSGPLPRFFLSLGSFNTDGEAADRRTSWTLFATSPQSGKNSAV